MGYLRADGPRLVDDDGQEIILRGVGLGNWLLPEGYMWRLPTAGDRPRRIESMVRELVGGEMSREFWDRYRDRYISQADIRRIRDEGFNSVRVPLNARFLLEEGEPPRCRESALRLVDRLIEWCATHGLYVILDLHGAPGGQTGTNIDDSEHDRPDLFTDERNQRLTVALWRMLAERYRDRRNVAGYDLLNEPLPAAHAVLYGEVMPLYRRITKAIREVDARHVIILQGVHWATDWSIFTERIDDNLMLQFHKYWNNPDTESIARYLDKREQWKVPIFMGEGGENNTDWYAGAFRLCEDHGISWNFWTWKKMDTDNSPCSITKPQDWQLLVGFLEGGSRPDREMARRILWEYLDSLPLDRCVYHPEVVRSLFRRPPVRIPAVFYGNQGEGKGFGIVDRVDRSVGFRSRDGTDIRFVQGARTVANFQHSCGEPWSPDERLCVHLAAGDWLAYEIAIQDGSAATHFSLEIHLGSPQGCAAVEVTVNGSPTGVAEASEGPWQTVRLARTFPLAPGPNRIVLAAVHGPIRVEWLSVQPIAHPQ